MATSMLWEHGIRVRFPTPQCHMISTERLKLANRIIKALVDCGDAVSDSKFNIGMFQSMRPIALEFLNGQGFDTSNCLDKTLMTCYNPNWRAGLNENQNR